MFFPKNSRTMPQFKSKQKAAARSRLFFVEVVRVGTPLCPFIPTAPPLCASKVCKGKRTSCDVSASTTGFVGRLARCCQQQLLLSWTFLQRLRRKFSCLTWSRCSAAPPRPLEAKGPFFCFLRPSFWIRDNSGKTYPVIRGTFSPKCSPGARAQVHCKNVRSGT